MQRWLKFSNYLPDYGWEPVVFAPDPRQATYPVRDNSLADSISDEVKVFHTRCTEFFSFYKRLSNTSKIPYAGFASESGPISRKQKISRFIRGNFFLPDPRKGWNKHAIKAIVNYLKEEKIDCIITTGPPHSTHLIGQKIKKIYGIPWVADFRDPWTDIYYYKEFYPTLLAHKINLKLEKKVLLHANKIITVSPTWKNLLGNKIPDGLEKVNVLTNGFDEKDFQLSENIPVAKEYITYVGTMSDIYPLEAFINAFARVLPEFPNAVFRLIGTVSENQRNKINSLPEKNVEFISYVDHKKAIEYMQEARMLLLLIPEHNSSKGIVPGKLFEYFAVGRPVLVIGDEEGDAATFVRENEAGEASSSGDTDKMFKIIHECMENKLTLSPNLKFSRRSLTKNLVKILEDV